MKEYNPAIQRELLYCGASNPIFGFFKDSGYWEDFNEEMISSYLKEGTSMLVEYLTEYILFATKIDSYKAKELRFMLEALLEAKEVFGGLSSTNGELGV